MAIWSPPKPSTAGQTPLDRYFHVSERGSTVRTEVIAGAATWLTMTYIVFVNPAILGSVKDHLGNFVSGGPSFNPAAAAAVTSLVACVMTLLMGVYANYPFALAAGLGLNAFVTFALVGAFGLTWPQAMGVIVWEGLMITLLVLTGFREMVMDAIPLDLKKAIGVGIGAFIAFIGLRNAGIVVKSDATLVTMNPDIRHLTILVFLIGLALTFVLVARKMRGALLASIVSTTIIASIINVVWGHSKVFLGQGPNVAKVPHHIFQSPDLGMLFNFSLNLKGIAIGTAIALVVSVMLSDFFDTMGTVVGIAGDAVLVVVQHPDTAPERHRRVEPQACVLGLDPAALRRVQERDRLHDEPPRTGLARCVVQRRRPLGADLVVGVVEVRVAQVVVARQRRELVDHRLGLGIEDHATHGLALQRVDHDAAGAELAECVRLVLAARQPDDLVPGVDELRDQEPADCARCACHEDSHVASVRSAACSGAIVNRARIVSRIASVTPALEPPLAWLTSIQWLIAWNDTAANATASAPARSGGNHADAISGTGVDGAQQLRCVGSAVPSADWQAFAIAESNIPSQCAGGFNELARSPSEWCRDKPCVKRRRRAASLPCLDCDAVSVGGDLDAADCRANLNFKAHRSREVRRLSSRNELDPYVCGSARV